MGKKNLAMAIEAWPSLRYKILRVPFFLEPDYDEEVDFVETNRERLVKKWGGRAGWEAQKGRHDLKVRQISGTRCPGTRFPANALSPPPF